MQELELTADRPRSRGMVLLPPVQRQFGRYLLLCRFASGGMANLFLARFAGPEGFNKLVAIKRIHEHLTEDREFVDMFVDEARLAARIEHPNVVQVLELGAVDSSYFIAMEYVPGESLVALLRRTTPPLPVSARIISQAALGLHAAHELRDTKGESLHVVHRDVSPGNILVSYQGVVKVTDFGVARARNNIHTTSAGTVKGKYAYMAPEQARSGTIDRRADIFALGIVLYELTTQRRLFKADSDVVTMAKVLNESITTPSKIVTDYPPALETVVMRALQRDPDKRYETAAAFHEALEAYIGQCGTPVLQTTIGEMIGRAFSDRIEEKERFLQRCERELAEEIAQLPYTPAASGCALQTEEHTRQVVWSWQQRLLKAVVVLGVVCLVLLLGYALLRKGSQSARQTVERRPHAAPGVAVHSATDDVASRSVEVRILVKVIPSQAAITLDGHRVSNPYHIKATSANGVAHVVASAAGYQTRRFDVPLTESGHWVIALDRQQHPSEQRESQELAPPLKRVKRGHPKASDRPVSKRLFDNPY